MCGMIGEMNKIHLKESITEAPVKAGNRWRVIVARPGQGSSGKYSTEMFRRDAHKIIAPGAQSFINHDDKRNPKDMIGTFPEAAYFDEAEQAVVAELEVFSHWKAFVEEVGPHCGISLYAMGESDEDGNVTEIFEDALNGADLVARPGLVGSGLAEKLYESAIAGTKEPTVTVAEKERNNMELEEKVDKALEILAGLVAEKDKAVAAEAQIAADKAAVKVAVESYSATVDAVEKADLLEPQRKAILEAAKEATVDVEALIAEAKVIKDAAIAAVTESREDAPTGRIFGEAKYESATDLGKVFG